MIKVKYVVKQKIGGRTYYKPYLYDFTTHREYIDIHASSDCGLVVTELCNGGDFIERTDFVIQRYPRRADLWATRRPNAEQKKLDYYSGGNKR